MAKIHDLFIVELAEVIKGYGNEPDDKDPFRLSEFYRFYELPNIAVSRENFEKMRSVEPERKTGKWIIRETAFEDIEATCSCCGFKTLVNEPGNGLHMVDDLNYCPNCGAYMKGGSNED